MFELAQSQLPSYTRLKQGRDKVQPTEKPDPALHNVKSRKLLGRCGIALIAVLATTIFALWMLDQHTGHETKSTPENTGTRLKFVALVHRHGARSGHHPYEFEKGIHWEVPPGKLLDVGFRNGFKFGQKLLQKYASGFGSITPASVAAFSTNVDRTIDTVHSVLTGLFSPHNTEMGEANCSCRPKEKEFSTQECVAKCVGVEKPSVLPEVKIWDKESERGAILQQYGVCNRSKGYFKKLKNSKEFKTATEVTYKDKLDYLTKEIVKKDTVVDSDTKKTSKIDLIVLTFIWDTNVCLAAQQDHSGPYKDPAKIAKELEEATMFVWHLAFSTNVGPELGGIFFDQIVKDLKQGAKRQATKFAEKRQFPASEKGPLMKIYSAHDTTLAGLLAAMNYRNWKYPYFLSNIIFELYGSSDTSKTDLKFHYIRVLYNDEPLVLGNCKDDFCPIMDFLTSMNERTRKIEDCKRN